ncbi:histidine phosphatase family protein [Nocardioides mangrovicus]|uniref:Histidine phosphatase family protein n=1 Tax=Nocardioides mangrovicus TaxID=2478913 RepID=A0A3L8P4K2_9ACTN|nr:histidine phosphatase family protein [Nocardioides mangrovicus]RLV49663.1 histidine phosphatase family protein [Nocardioides mangrovicus]
MRRLVLLRHGRTAWNADLRAQGQTDVPLDETGREQAARVAPGIAALRPSALWSSDLARAAKTADAVAAACGLDLVLDPRLRELDVGDRSGLTPAEFAERFPLEHAAWARGEDSPRVPGEESLEQLVARVSAGLRALLAALGPDDLGVAVLHGWCAKAAMVDLLGLPPGSHAVVRGLDNCHAAVLLEHGTGLRLQAYNVDLGAATPS